MADEPAADPRHSVSSVASSNVWADVIQAEDKANPVEESEGDACCTTKENCAAISGNPFLGFMFTLVIIFEFVRTYCQTSTWALFKCFSATKERELPSNGCLVCFHYTLLFWTGLFWLIFKALDYGFLLVEVGRFLSPQRSNL
jgi:hypothetical protein